MNRIYFLDNLRAFVVLCVVVLHGSMTYMAYAPTWWYVLDSQNSLFFTALVLLIDVPIMPIMFFIAGYFAWPALQKRGSRQFLRDKFVRIGLPWILGALFLAPPIAYMIYFTRHIPMGYLQFWATDFWGPLYQQSVYWFLGVLFTMFLVLSLVYARSDRWPTPLQRIDLPSSRLFVVFAGLTTAGFLVMSLYFSPDTWSHIYYLLVFQPVRVPLYIGYFVLGLYAYRRGWFTVAGYRPSLGPWAAGWLLSGLTYLSLKLAVPAALQVAVSVKVGTALLFNAFCLSSLMAGAAFFQQRVDSAGPFWRSLAANAYGIYYVHPLILYPLAYALVPLALPLGLKAPLLLLVATLLSWGVSALVLKKAPLLRDLF